MVVLPVIAVSRFGNFSHLGQTASSPSDVYRSMATLTFHGASYPVHVCTLGLLAAVLWRTASPELYHRHPPHAAPSRRLPGNVVHGPQQPEPGRSR